MKLSTLIVCTERYKFYLGSISPLYYDFFVRKFCEKLFCAWTSLLAQGNWRNCAHKMLVKLTSCHLCHFSFVLLLWYHFLTGWRLVATSNLQIHFSVLRFCFDEDETLYKCIKRNQQLNVATRLLRGRRRQPDLYELVRLREFPLLLSRVVARISMKKNWS